MPLLQENRKYTYADYLTWPDDLRIELIHGIPYNRDSGEIVDVELLPKKLQPRITCPEEHDKICHALFNRIEGFLCGSFYIASHGSLDVLLPEQDGVVQPDIAVVLDQSKLDGKCCNGAPDLIVEILAPSSSRYDRVVKFQKYLASGVREYWIVDPVDKIVQVFILQGGLYVAHMYADTDTVPVSVLEGCSIELKEVFSE